MPNEDIAVINFRTGFNNVDHQIIMHELLFYSLIEAINPEKAVTAIQKTIDNLVPPHKNSEIEKKLVEVREFFNSYADE